MGLRWEQNLIVFIIYGVIGGSGEAKDCTNDIIDPTREEIRHDPSLPTILMGSFNAKLETLISVIEVIDDEAWAEIGSNADWRGQLKILPTHWSRVNLRIVQKLQHLVNKAALLIVHDPGIEKDDMIPIHAAISLKLSTCASAERGKVTKTRAVVKKFCEQDIKEDAIDEETAKEKAARRKT